MPILLHHGPCQVLASILLHPGQLLQRGVHACTHTNIEVGDCTLLPPVQGCLDCLSARAHHRLAVRHAALYSTCTVHGTRSSAVPQHTRTSVSSGAPCQHASGLDSTRMLELRQELEHMIPAAWAEALDTSDGQQGLLACSACGVVPGDGWGGGERGSSCAQSSWRVGAAACEVMSALHGKHAECDAGAGCTVQYKAMGQLLGS